MIDSDAPTATAVQPLRPTRTARDGSARRWWVLAVMSVAQLLITVDVTIVNVALPDAQHALGFSNASRQWVITAYALAFGSLLLVGGRIADRLGRQRTLLAGLVMFGVGSALGGAAPNFAMLAAARALQGVGGALLAPAALGTVTATFTAPAERARAFSVFGTVGGMGAALGLLLGGFLTQDLNWRWTLYVNFALSIATLIATLVVVPADRPEKAPRFDTVGTAMASAGLFGIVFGLSRAETDGWASASTWGALLAACVLLIAFVWRQRVTSSPLVPLRIFADRNRAASLGALMMVNTGIFAAFLFLTYYLQQTLHYTPIKTGAAFLPLIGGTLLGSGLALNVVPRLAGPRISVPVGMLTAAASLLWLTSLNTHTGYAPVIVTALTVLGAGVGLVFPVAMNLGTAGVHADDHGVAGALVNTTQQVGGSIGVALLSTISASATARYDQARHGTGPAVLQHAILHGYAVAYVIAAVIFAAGAVVAAAGYRSGIPDEVRNGQMPVPA